MTINFFAPGDVPKPKDQVTIEKLGVEVHPDRWRVKVSIKVTPFMVRPNVGVVLLKDDAPTEGVFVASDMTIIETMHNDMEFTMHIRGVDDPEGNYTLKTRLYYEQGIQHPSDEKQHSFHIGTDDEFVE